MSADATLLETDCTASLSTGTSNLQRTVSASDTTRTEFGQRLDAGKPWYQLALETNEGDIAIGDPDLDPLGYRAVQAFELAETEHGLEFRETMMDLVYGPKPQMMAGVEAGSRAGAIVYRNMAIDHGMPFFEFPDEYNFANPELADHYATVEFTGGEGTPPTDVQ